MKDGPTLSQNNQKQQEERNNEEKEGAVAIRFCAVHAPVHWRLWGG